MKILATMISMIIMQIPSVVLLKILFMTKLQLSLYPLNESIRSVQTFGNISSNKSRNTNSCSNIMNMYTNKRKTLGLGVGPDIIGRRKESVYEHER